MKQLQLFSTPETQAKSSFSEWEIDRSTHLECIQGGTRAVTFRHQQGLEKEKTISD